MFEEMKYDQGIPSVSDITHETYYSPPYDFQAAQEYVARGRISPIADEEVVSSAVTPMVPMEIHPMEFEHIPSPTLPPTRRMLDLEELPMPPPKRVLKNRVNIDERVELSNAILRQRMRATTPTVREERWKNPCRFKQGIAATPTIWNMMEQRWMSVSVYDLREVLNYSTNRKPFPLKRARVEPPAIPIAPQAIETPPSVMSMEGRPSISSMETAADLEFARMLSCTEV